MADLQSVMSKALYESPIGESSNVRYVENRIIINAPHNAVFDFVTTWSNLPKWLPVAKSVSVRKGNPNGPAGLGDELYEAVNPSPSWPAHSKIYTVVVSNVTFARNRAQTNVGLGTGSWTSLDCSRN